MMTALVQPNHVAIYICYNKELRTDGLYPYYCVLYRHNGVTHFVMPSLSFKKGSQNKVALHV